MRDLAEGLAELFPDTEVEVLDTGEGYFRVNASWPDGARCKLDVHPDYVDWKSLDAPTDARATGFYTMITEVTPPFFKEYGCSYYLMSPRSDKAKERLLKRLDWYELDGRWRHDL